MKKYFKQYIRFSLILVLSIGISYVIADNPYTGPTAIPPKGNTPTPIYTGLDQIKKGGLSVGSFLANQNASFGSSVYFQKFIKGVVDPSPYSINDPRRLTYPGASIVHFGKTQTTVDAVVTGGLTVADDVTETNLANDQNLNVCGDDAGNIVLCTVPTGDLCSNIGGIQTVVPNGYWRNDDGTCDQLVDYCTNIPGRQPATPYGYVHNTDNTCSYTIYGSAAISVDWDKGYKTSCNIFNSCDKYRAPLSLIMNLTNLSPTSIKFKWGYCVEIKRLGQSLYDQRGGYCVSFDQNYPFPYNNPFPLQSLPYPSVADPKYNPNLNGKWDNNYGGFGTISAGYKTFTGDMLGGIFGYWYELFDGKGNIDSGYNYYPPAKIIVYDVDLPPYYFLDLGPDVEVHYK